MQTHIEMPPSTKAPGSIDREIGRRIRSARHTAGFSQERLGKALGITFQQLQKYESGTNRISASRLISLAGVLGVKVSKLLPAGRA